MTNIDYILSYWTLSIFSYLHVKQNKTQTNKSVVTTSIII